MNTSASMALTFVTVLFSLGAFAQDSAERDRPEQVSSDGANSEEGSSADFNVKVQAGAEYDSTLTVAELDQTANKGDWAEILNGRLSGELRPTDRFTLKGSYSFASRDYREYDAFNQDLHIAALDAGLDLGGMTVGVSHHFAHAKLDAQPFLNLSKTSLYAAKLFNSRIYFRGAVSGSRKSFENSRERNVDGDELSADVYYFFNNARSFWSLGVSHETEDARSSAYDNKALKLRARYSYTGELAGRKSQTQLAWSHQKRDYRSQESLIKTNNTRHDRSQVVEASWALGLVEWLTLETKIEYGNYRSNLEAADYRGTSVSALLSAEF